MVVAGGWHGLASPTIRLMVVEKGAGKRPEPADKNVCPTLRDYFRSSLRDWTLHFERRRFIAAAGEPLFPPESKKVAVGSDVHDVFNQGRCGANFLANDISSQHLHLFGARIYHDNCARV